MNEQSLGVLRRGWIDAVNAEAPHVTGVSELLQRRLEELAGRGHLDEAHLNQAVDEASELTVESGAADVSHALERRLRRTVYEYLLSLDATAEDVAPSSDPIPMTDVLGGPLIGAEEVASLEPEPAPAAADEVAEEAGRRPAYRFRFFRHGGAAAAEAPDDVADEPATPEPVTEMPPDPAPSPANEEILAPAASASPPTTPAEPVPLAPRRGFHIGDPSDFVSQAPADSAAEPAGDGGAPAAAGAPAQPTAFSDPSTWPLAVPARATADEAPAAIQTAEWHARETASAPAAETAAEPAAAVPEPAPSMETATEEVVPAEAPEAEPAAPSELTVGLDEVGEAEVAEARGAVDAKLRKKRCDEAAALLQSLAQDLGGRQVAELALDAGDRCRVLGKANAALNCYLAASRADPVYEAPLARLADICIDDQDIDLAVSYLERIARLMRLRGDAKGALRIYRKIATVAPYRDDVLELLMRAQTTGRLEA